MHHLIVVLLTLGLVAGGTMAVGTWKVMNDDKACLLLNMDLNFTVDYSDTKHATKSMFSLPENATVYEADSSCGDTESNIILKFYDTYSLLFKFKIANKRYQLYYVNFKYTEDSTRFPDSKEPGKPKTKEGDVTEFETDVGYSYRCNSLQGDASINGLLLDFSNIKLQPFGVEENGTFSKEFVCDADLVTTTAQPTIVTNMTTAMMTNMTTVIMTNMTTVIMTNMTTAIMTNMTTAIMTNMTTVMSTTATPKPTSPPKPTVGNWTVKGSDGKPCMNMVFNANFSFSYKDDKNKSVKANVALPFNASSNMSSCSTNTSVFILDFEHFDEVWIMAMTFDQIDSKNYPKRNGGYNAFHLSEMNITYYTPLHDEMEAYTNESFFETKYNKTYKCVADSKIDFGGLNITFSDVQFQPFADGVLKHEVQDCKLDDKSSNIVPIAVGCALAGLVVIVLIAYLIGRKRTKNVGYQTV